MPNLSFKYLLSTCTITVLVNFQRGTKKKKKISSARLNRKDDFTITSIATISKTPSPACLNIESLMTLHLISCTGRTS